MATLALGAAGAAIGSAFAGGGTLFTLAGTAVSGAAFGWGVGATIGSFADSYALAALSARSVKGPRLNDLSPQTASEGSALPLVIGVGRTTGTLIWQSELRERRKKEGGKGGGSSTSYSYNCDAAIAVCEGPIAEVKKVWADSKLIYDDGDLDPRYASITLYTGSDTQTADPVIAAIETNVPAFRGIAYIVVERLQLADFGNRLPTFTFEVVQQTPCTVRNAIDRIMARGDFETYDVTGVPDVVFKGMLITGQDTAARSLSQIMLAYDLVAREEEGTLVFLGRSNADEVEVTGFGAGPDMAPRPSITVERASDRDLPREVVVNYLNEENDYQAGSERERRQGGYTNSVVVDMPLVMSSTDARALARRLLWSAWSESMQLTALAPMAWAHTQEGDEVPTEYGAMRVKSVSRGWDGIVELRGHTEQSHILDAAGLSTPYDPTGAPLPETTVHFVVMNLPPLQDIHANTPGIYVAARSNNWRGATVFFDLDEDSDLEEAATIRDEGTIGEVDGVLADADWTVLDTVNEIEVQLDSGTLETVSTTAVTTLGRNIALVGNEIIGFTTVVDNGGGSYTLSNLYRGLRGTHIWSDTHYDGERFVLLDEALRFIPVPIAFTSLVVVVAGYLSDPSAVTPLTVSYTAETVKCLPCVELDVTRDGSNNATIVWERRSRLLQELIEDEEGPTDEAVEKYRVRLYDGTTLVRTVDVLEPTYIYTAALQTTDGITPGDPFGVRVAQIGFHGEGRSSEPESL